MANENKYVDSLSSLTHEFSTNFDVFLKTANQSNLFEQIIYPTIIFISMIFLTVISSKLKVGFFNKLGFSFFVFVLSMLSVFCYSLLYTPNAIQKLRASVDVNLIQAFKKLPENMFYEFSLFNTLNKIEFSIGLFLLIFYFSTILLLGLSNETKNIFLYILTALLVLILGFIIFFVATHYKHETYTEKINEYLELEGNYFVQENYYDDTFTHDFKILFEDGQYIVSFDDYILELEPDEFIEKLSDDRFIKYSFISFVSLKTDWFERVITEKVNEDVLDDLDLSKIEKGLKEYKIELSNRDLIVLNRTGRLDKKDLRGEHRYNVIKLPKKNFNP